MKYIDEFRDGELAKNLAASIAARSKASASTQSRVGSTISKTARGAGG